MLDDWLIENDYKSFDPFDGLNSNVRFLTFENHLLRIFLENLIRRFPINLRPILGVHPWFSSKGFGFLAKAYLNMYKITGDKKYFSKSRGLLNWLVLNRSKGYTGPCWGNHFDEQSRMSLIPKGHPTIVWTSLIGHSFLDMFEFTSEKSYLKIAIKSCEHIVLDLNRIDKNDEIYFDYHPNSPINSHQVHNSNVLGASLLVRTGHYSGNDNFVDISRKAINFTMNRINTDYSWFYGTYKTQNWVDNFHTGYVLDSVKDYIDFSKDTTHIDNLNKAFEYYVNHFFLKDGTPKYYNNQIYPIDIQCSSQAIDTLVKFSHEFPKSIDLALEVASWTIDNMQAKSGYFFFRKYPFFYNKTPTLHWGQCTMFRALSNLLLKLKKPK